MEKEDFYDDDYIPIGSHNAMLEGYHAHEYGAEWRKCHETVPGLFIGPMEARHEVQHHGIDLVVSLLQDYERQQKSYPQLPPGVEEHIYVLDDSLNTELSYEFLAEIILIIHHALTKKQRRVLVHCAAGRSRSASVVIAYFLASGVSFTVDEALARLKTHRSCVRPNVHFKAQLVKMEKKLYWLCVAAPL